VTTTVVEPVAPQEKPQPRQAARVRFPPRPPQPTWPATEQPREAALASLTSPPFVLAKPGSQSTRASGCRLLLDWLLAHDGDTWQQRWQATGAENAGADWRRLPTRWLRDQGRDTQWPRWAMAAAVNVAIAADLIRPSPFWLAAGATGRGALVAAMAAGRDVEGFARLRALCDTDPDVRPAPAKQSLHRSAEILAAKGGTLADIVVGDVLELLDAEHAVQTKTSSNRAVFYRLLHTLGIFGDTAPATLRELRTTGQRTPAEMIDRHRLVCRPIRDLLVDYLTERQPSLDYISLESLAGYLAGRFWADLERHHPGIESLHLSKEVADGWKQRLRTVTKTTVAPSGERVSTTTERISYRECLTPVRAFYLDLAHWAVEDPARWGPWVAPCPVSSTEVDRRKAQRHRKSRMDARTRERLPVLPVLVEHVNRERGNARTLLDAGRQARPGDTFAAAGRTLVRATTPHGRADKIWADDPTSGTRHDLTLEEDHAFWAFAFVEVLRSTGVRVEELLELSHHSLVQYRLPSTGELVPLLQIAPSKTDTERLLLVDPDLADVLGAIIGRIRERSGAVPLVRAYDTHECVWSPPAPLLFQRRVNGENRAITPDYVRRTLIKALHHTGLADPATGTPIRFTPHDFRRLFITDAVLNGLPPHIAQVIAGHRDINVTMGYKAVYPEEAVQAHLAFLARRRALRPTDEYRTPTDDEWQEFLGHFERRKVSIGTCGRAFGSPCIHEHACVRCALLWPDPAQRHRLVEIRDNLVARIAEAEREGWLGEVEGLRVSLAAAEDKLTQTDKRRHPTTELGNPAFPADS